MPHVARIPSSRLATKTTCWSWRISELLHKCFVLLATCFVHSFCLFLLEILSFNLLIKMLIFRNVTLYLSWNRRYSNYPITATTIELGCLARLVDSNSCEALAANKPIDISYLTFLWYSLFWLSTLVTPWHAATMFVAVALKSYWR